MSTQQSQATEAIAPNNSGGEEEEDLGALIYRESQLRKAEIAAEAGKRSLLSAPTPRRTSTRKRTPVNHGEKSLPSPQRKGVGASKRRKRESSPENQPRIKVRKKNYTRYECSADGCTNGVIKGGVCRRHGAKAILCSSEGCTNHVQNGGVCKKHGAKKKLCSSEGCTNQAKLGGVCIRHGAKVKRCSRDGCTNYAQRGGICIKHGAKKQQRKLCSTEGCTNQVKRGGVCRRHNV